MLRNGEGQTTDRYSYDAFGNLLKKEGNTKNDFLYTGEQYNADTGLLMNTDPSGYFSLAECSAVQGIQSTMNSIRRINSLRKLVRWADGIILKPMMAIFGPGSQAKRYRKQ